MEKARILIIEDNQGLRILAKKYLEKNGFEVVEASDGVQGLKALQLFNDIKLIFLDLMMPNLSGFDFLKRVKDFNQNNNFRICVMTAKEQGNDIKECLKSGAEDYIVKPVDEDILIDKAKILLGQDDRGEFSVIKVDFHGEIELPSGQIAIHINKLSENYFTFTSRIELPISGKIFIKCPQIEKLLNTEKPFLARIFKCERNGKEFLSTATFIGFKETEYSKIRFVTNKGRDL